jgi:arylsulfatase A-like enzyme
MRLSDPAMFAVALCLTAGCVRAQAMPGPTVPGAGEAATRLALEPSSPVATSQSGAAAPNLVVFITVDQLLPDYLDLYGSEFTGGLARLLGGGAYFTNAFHDHAITETAPGHASTLSGRFPYSTGIVANMSGVEDPRSPLLEAPEEGASPARFRGTTLADWIKARDPRARALSVSRKDRGAILPLGKAKGEAFWYSTNGTFTTSRYYADTLPTWVRSFNAREIPQSYAGKVWELLLPAASYTEADTVEAESNGIDYVFPHRFPDTRDGAAAVLATYPMMDEVTLQFAMAGVQALELGADPSRTDLLAISLSTTDAMGHRFGPDSRELHDHIIRLDRYLGTFLDSLFRLRDSANVVIALTSDHGVAPIVDRSVKSRYRKSASGFADIYPMVRGIYQDLRKAGVDTSAFRWDYNFLVLEPAGLAKAHVKRDSLARLYAAALRRVDGVLRADVVSDLARKDTTKDAVARRWLHMLPPDLNVAVTVTLKPYWYIEGTPNPATHGTPHDYDAHVPVLFYGTGVKAGRYPEFTRVVDMAPTLASILGVPPLERLDGHVLSAAIK